MIENKTIVHEHGRDRVDSYNRIDAIEKFIKSLNHVQNQMNDMKKHMNELTRRIEKLEGQVE